VSVLLLFHSASPTVGQTKLQCFPPPSHFNLVFSFGNRAPGASLLDLAGLKRLDRHKTLSLLNRLLVTSK
jgi:hypothetical protein